mgnify:FL=1
MIGSYTHSELRETIREYTTEDGGFHFESVLDLVLAGIDNLAKHSTEGDFQGLLSCWQCLHSIRLPLVHRV